MQIRFDANQIRKRCKAHTLGFISEHKTIHLVSELKTNLSTAAHEKGNSY